MIAKSGCTSLATFLVAAEVVSSKHRDNSLRLTHFSSALADGQSIHSGDSILRSFRVAHIPPDASVRLVVLRNPHRRFMSMFANKFIDQHDQQIWRKYGHLPWNIDPLDSLDTARAKVIEMLHWLNDGHLLEDPHWRPQSAFLDKDNPYNAAADVSELHRVPVILEQLDPKLSWLSTLEMPHRNPSDYNTQQLLYTRPAAILVEAIYASDFSHCLAHGLDAAEPRICLDTEGPEIQDAWKRAQTRMAVRRLENRTRYLEAHIAQIETSRSWRLTRPLRRAAEAKRRLTARS